MPDEKFSEKGIIPEGTIATTLGIDSQSDGFYFLLACWGRRMECWLPCLEFVRAHGWLARLRAVRGYAAQRAVVSGRSFGILRNRYVDKSTGVTVTNVDVDIAKSQLANMLARKDPGPGYVHLPCAPDGGIAGGWDLDAVGELTAEYRRQSNQRGYTVSRWYKKSNRPNHRLDCLTYSLAALAISRLKIDTCPLQRVEARHIGKPAPAQDSERSPFGARKMFVKSDPVIGGLAGYGVELPPDHRRPAGWGALPGSGVCF